MNIYNDPAFPVENNIIGAHNGMNLRDYFAAKAMQALINTDRFGNNDMAQLSNRAYQYAQAMLEARPI